MLVEPSGFLIKYYSFNQHEETEQLTYVEDFEIPVDPYVSLMSLGKQSEPEVRMSAVDVFRQQALMKMMDGVLEKKWEDELKLDVPKPRCMVALKKKTKTLCRIGKFVTNTQFVLFQEAKKPEEYEEDDLRAINEYEKLAAARDEERLVYKGILEEKKAKITENIEAAIEEFDKKILLLLNKRLKHDLAIEQECSKIATLTNMMKGRNDRDGQIKKHGY